LTDKFDGIAISLNNRIFAPDTVKRVQLCEELGYSEVWLPYHVGQTRGLWTVAGAALQATSRITIGLGIAVPYLQDPLVLAQDVATLDELGRGRFILGLGSALWIMNWVWGFSDKRPLRYMRETIEIVNALMRGEAVPETELFKYERPLKLEFKPYRSHVPIYLGAINKQMLRLTGRIADGVKLGAICSPPYIRRCVQYLHEGLAKANRDPKDFVLGGNVMISIDEDHDKAREATKWELGYYVQRVDKIVLEDTGIPQEDIQAVKDAFTKGGRSATVEKVTEQMIDVLAVAGDPSFCVKKLRNHAQAGLHVLHAWNVDTNVDPDRTIRLIADHLIPELT
jgi:alkanesulfonate monooxygenase SsuD/methylene tetrahydromethanopterin reductase-like flavin-dependent oxidoreductase (luciferase family)